MTGRRDLDGGLGLLALAGAGLLCPQMAHDVNNILMAMLGHAHIGLSTRRQEKLVRAVETATESAEELRAMIESLTRISSSSDDDGMALENLAEAIRPVLRLLQRPLAKANVFVHPIQGEAPAVMCHRGSIAAAAGALLLRILRECRSAGGGDLWISLVPSGTFLELRIEASRKGQPEEPLSAQEAQGEIGEGIAGEVARRHGGDLLQHRTADRTGYVLRLPVGIRADGDGRVREPQPAHA